MKLRRRTLLQVGGVTALGAALPFSRLFSPRAEADHFGGLEPDPEGVLDLPPGFTYRIVERSGMPMSDGYRVPARPDGMAAFAGPAGTVVLMRNHEVSDGSVREGPYNPGQDAPAEAYTETGMGGVTRVVVDAASLERVSSNLVLTGTVRNCAGGPSPWGWLSCEENVSPGHGYVFRCPSDAERVRAPERIAAYGRFNHEAVAIDVRDHTAYLTEDRSGGCLYRFVPVSMDRPFEGQLQAMRLVGMDGIDTGGGLELGVDFEVDWVDIDEPDPAADTVRTEARGKGAAVIRRGEGIWYGNGAVYFSATTGGPRGLGQIFRYEPGDSGGGGRLRLLAQSDDAAVLEKPDNVAVAPSGDLYICEDGDGENFLRILSRDGTLSTFARNARSDSELAGVCFAPDGGTMFVNLQRDGLTLAVTGPFHEMQLADGGVATDGGATGADAGGVSADAAAAGDGGPSPEGGMPSESAGGGCSASGAGSEQGGVGAAGALAVGLTGALRSRRAAPQGDDEQKLRDAPST